MNLEFQSSNPAAAKQEKKEKFLEMFSHANHLHIQIGCPFFWLVREPKLGTEIKREKWPALETNCCVTCTDSSLVGGEVKYQTCSPPGDFVSNLCFTSSKILTLFCLRAGTVVSLALCLAGGGSCKLCLEYFAQRPHTVFYRSLK